MPGEGSRGRSWREHTVLAAVISAAAVLGAGLGGAVIANTGWPGDEPATPQPTVTVTRYVTATAAGSSPSAAPANAKVRWAGELTLAENYADLDVVPPNNAADPGSNDVRLTRSETLNVPEKSLRWTESGDPTERECAARLRTDGFEAHSYERPEAGQRYCLVTSAGRTALVRFETAATLTGDRFSAKVRVTVWSNADG